MDYQSTCDGCGADLPAPDAKGFVTCPSCGRVTKVEVDPPEPTVAPGDIVIHTGWSGASPGAMPPLGTPTDTTSELASAATKAGVGCGVTGAIIAVVVFLFVGGIILAVSRAGDSAKKAFSSANTDVAGAPVAVGNTITLDGSVDTIVGYPDPSDLTVVVQDSSGDKTNRYLDRVKAGPGGFKRVWRSPALGRDAYRADTANDGKQLYAAIGKTLYAFDFATGKEVWKTTLRDSLSSCDGCIAVVEGKLIIRTQDGYLTGFAPGSPKAIWSRRLDSTSGAVASTGGHYYVSDSVNGNTSLSRVHAIDPATGDDRRSFAPSCPAGSDGGGPVTMSDQDRPYAVPGSKDLVMAFGFGDGCVVRWNPLTGRQAWTLRATGASEFQRDATLVTAKDMVVETEGGELVHVNMASGEGKELAFPTDETAKPWKILGRVLLAKSETSRGSTKGGLIAWNLDSTTRLWDITIPGGAQASSDEQESNALFDDQPRFAVTASGSQGHVFIFSGQKPTLTTYSLDLTTGNLGAPADGELKTPDGGTPSLTLEAAGTNWIIVSVDTVTELIPNRGTGIETYPN